MFIVELTEGI